MKDINKLFQEFQEHSGSSSGGEIEEFKVGDSIKVKHLNVGDYYDVDKITRRDNKHGIGGIVVTTYHSNQSGREGKIIDVNSTYAYCYLLDIDKNRAWFSHSMLERL